MKSLRQVIYITTKNKIEVVDITDKVVEFVKKSDIREGFVLVFPLHTSSAVYISDSDINLCQDYLDTLGRLLPQSADYKHNLIDYKKNAVAHLAAILTGHNIILPLTDGEVDIGNYQTIYYAEFDGQRQKEILIKIIGE